MTPFAWRDGFLWNAAEKAGLSVQNFGEYIYNPYSLPAGSPDWDTWYAESQWLENGHNGPEPISNPCQYTRVQSDIPSLQAISDPCFPNFQLSIPDQYRVDQWLPVFHQQKKSGNMPKLTFMWLMTDHTTGTNVPDPVAQVADNDLAVGRVAEAVSHSPYWDDTAIFILEDDAQDGQDHVDAHRSIAFAISKYSPGTPQTPYVDHRFYTTVNMIHTVEMLLGIPPMNQNDAYAPVMGPMLSGPGNQPPFEADYRNRISGLIYETNKRDARGASESTRMDFSHPDAAPAARLNQVLWRDQKGDVPMPAPKHVLFPAGGD